MGVILFLRLGWSIGQVGWVGCLVMLTVGEIMAFTTVLSFSAIVTNGNMRGGGSYFMISRCLGPEYGGAIGLLFYIAYAVGCACECEEGRGGREEKKRKEREGKEKQTTCQSPSSAPTSRLPSMLLFFSPNLHPALSSLLFSSLRFSSSFPPLPHFSTSPSFLQSTASAWRRRYR